MAKYFSLGQCIYSKTAIDNNLDNTPGVDVNEKPDLTKDVIIDNMSALMKNCINPIKDKFPNIIITSVYRSIAVNRAVKGVENSQHIAGMAADIVDLSDTNTSSIFNWVVNNLPEWNQLIWEAPERGLFSRNPKSHSWIHISYKEGDNPKTQSVYSLNKMVHSHYRYQDGTYSSESGHYTHGIKLANQLIINQL
tara:strand:+ start:1250 stop:1831 length:582 start_codon:yes stop_codon:yes gene_type:complete